MQIIEPSVRILAETPDMEKLIEFAVRHCYKSEDKITEDSYKRMIDMVLKKGHTSTLEHASISIELFTNRGVLAEITRHRLASFSVESTRYCNYSTGKKGMKFCRPFWMDKAVADSMTKHSEWDIHCLENDIKNRGFSSKERILYQTWYSTAYIIEQNYNILINEGFKPELARGILCSDLAVSMVLTANVREWRHILSLRHDIEHAHPDIVYLMDILLKELNKKHPVLFPIEDFPSSEYKFTLPSYDTTKKIENKAEDKLSSIDESVSCLDIAQKYGVSVRKVQKEAKRLNLPFFFKDEKTKKRWYDKENGQILDKTIADVKKRKDIKVKIETAKAKVVYKDHPLVTDERCFNPNYFPDPEPECFKNLDKEEN